MIASGSVFALGPLGHLVAVDVAAGRILWRTDLRELVQATRPDYGFASSPLVAGGVLVVQVGAGSGQAIAAFDLATGARRWTTGEDTVEYQSPPGDGFPHAGRRSDRPHLDQQRRAGTRGRWPGVPQDAS